MPGSVKIILMGPVRAGKSLFCRAIPSSADSDTVTLDAGYTATIGMEFFNKVAPPDSAGEAIPSQLWDTSGQDRFRSVTRGTYHGAGAVIIMLDTNSLEYQAELNDFLDEYKVFCEWADGPKPLLVINSQTTISPDSSPSGTANRPTVADIEDALSQRGVRPPRITVAELPHIDFRTRDAAAQKAAYAQQANTMFANLAELAHEHRARSRQQDSPEQQVRDEQRRRFAQQVSDEQQASPTSSGAAASTAATTTRDDSATQQASPANSQAVAPTAATTSGATSFEQSMTDAIAQCNLNLTPEQEDYLNGKAKIADAQPMFFGKTSVLFHPLRWATNNEREKTKVNKLIEALTTGTTDSKIERLHKAASINTGIFAIDKHDDKPDAEPSAASNYFTTGSKVFKKPT